MRSDLFVGELAWEISLAEFGPGILSPGTPGPTRISPSPPPTCRMVQSNFLHVKKVRGENPPTRANRPFGFTFRFSTERRERDEGRKGKENGDRPPTIFGLKVSAG